MDPQKQGTMTTMNILINIFDTLVTRDENGNLAPALATEWKAIDELTWQFKLREGVKFSMVMASLTCATTRLVFWDLPGSWGPLT